MLKTKEKITDELKKWNTWTIKKVLMMSEEIKNENCDKN
jgi:hypothetical protein